MLEDIEDPVEVESVVNKIIEDLQSPYHVKNHELYIGVSMGISLYPDDGEDVDTLVKNADAAMYRSKDRGRNTFSFYTREMTESVIERLHLETSLRHVVDRGELELYFQPQISLSSQAIVGAEALLRWRHSEAGLISPLKFIPLAEDTGLINGIGAWVLLKACLQARKWLDQKLSLETIAVNLSGVQILRDDIVLTVQHALSTAKLPAHCLELEITESVLMQDPERAIMALEQLRDLGVRLAIDDFGTGYSSLSYLKRFPINRLKIDKSFVSDIPNDSNDEAITKAVIVLGHSLQLEITAEGVETELQQRFLLAHGCEKAQGFLYSPPVNAAEFESLMKKQDLSSLPLLS